MRPISQALLAAGLCLSLLTAIGRADIRPLLLDAQEQFKQTRYDQALKLYKQADEKEPDHPAVAYDIGMCHLYLDDADKAVQQFERVASQTGAPPALRRDAFYNIGWVRSRLAHQKLEQLMAPATQPSDQKPAPDAPENIQALQGIADQFLQAITAFRQSRDLEPSEDAEHNIRTARIIRRNVLGLLQRATQAKEKEDILKDPRAYLESLILEQDQQVSLTRYLTIKPPAEAAAVRQARRDAIRLQRKLMEKTGVLADQLAQFRQPQPDKPGPATAPASTQPAEQTPLEKAYHAASQQLKKTVDSQRDACAFLLDGEVKPAWDKQFKGLEEMHLALYLFPLDPPPALAKARGEQAALKELVDGVRKDTDWLNDPLLSGADWPADAKWDADKTSLYYHQMQITNVLALLYHQCQYLATRPAEENKSAQPQKDNPLLDRELNDKLSKILAGVMDLRSTCLKAVTDHNRRETLDAQDKLLKMIDAAIELLPRTIEQRLVELIGKQSQLNSEVKGEADDADNPAAKSDQSPLDQMRQWASKLKSRLLAPKPAKIAEELNGRQQKIQKETGVLTEQIRKEIPSGAEAQAASPGSPPASQPAQVKAMIEAGKYVANADSHMTEAVEGLNKATVENSRKPLRPEGPVQAPQTKALDELTKALMALRPPQSQPQEDQQDQKDQKKQQQQQQPDKQDIQRALEQAEKKRQDAERELYKRRPRTVIKDW